MAAPVTIFKRKKAGYDTDLIEIGTVSPRRRQPLSQKEIAMADNLQLFEKMFLEEADLVGIPNFGKGDVFKIEGQQYTIERFYPVDFLDESFSHYEVWL